MHGTMVKLLLPRIFIRYGPAQYSALQGMFAPEMPPFFGHLPVRFSSFHVIQNTPFPA